MNLSATSLEQLGASAHGHYKAGEKAQDRAEQQMLAAGLYLKEAKDRLDLRKNPNAPMNFAQFLLHHCPIGKSRAYEIIAIADGRKTAEDLQEEKRESMRASRASRAETETFHNVVETTERTQDDTGHSQTPDRGGKQHPDRHIRETDGSAAQRGAEGSSPIDSGTRPCPSSQGHFVSGTCGQVRGDQEDHSVQTDKRTQQPKPTSPQGRATTFIDEAQAAHDALVKEVIALVRKQDATTLLNIKELLQ